MDQLANLQKPNCHGSGTERMYPCAHCGVQMPKSGIVAPSAHDLKKWDSNTPALKNKRKNTQLKVKISVWIKNIT